MKKNNERGRSPKKDLSGQLFGGLSVLRKYAMYRNKTSVIPIWLCQCSCGKTVKVLEHNLISTRSTTCGAPIHRGHGLLSCRTPACGVWQHLSSGLRGFRSGLHPDWEDFIDFHADVGEEINSSFISNAKLVLAPVDPEKPVGPDNYVFVERGRYMSYLSKAKIR